jgi:hypothetical protein
MRVKAKAIAGPTFWADLEPDIAAGGGVAHYNDGDLQYAALRATATMSIVRRTTEELFSATAISGWVNAALKAIINGNLFDVTRSGKLDAFSGHDPVPAGETTSYL